MYLSLLINVELSNEEKKEISSIEKKFLKEQNYYEKFLWHLENLARKIKTYELIGNNEADLNTPKYYEYGYFFGWFQKDGILFPSIRIDILKISKGLEPLKKSIKKIFNNKNHFKMLIKKSQLDKSIIEFQKFTDSRYTCDEIERLRKEVNFEKINALNLQNINGEEKIPLDTFSLTSQEIHFIKSKINNPSLEKILNMKLSAKKMQEARNWDDAHLVNQKSGYFQVNFEDLYKAAGMVYSSLSYIKSYLIGKNSESIIRNQLGKHNKSYHFNFNNLEEDLTIQSLKKLLDIFKNK